MAKVWNEDDVVKLSDAELKNLMNNAIIRKIDVVVNLCSQEIERRRQVSKGVATEGRVRVKTSSAGSSEVRRLEIEADSLLVSFVFELSNIYDLTEARASSLARKPFRPHSLLARNNRESKLGGLRSQGRVAIYRYISYRLNDDILSLSGILIEKEDNLLLWRVDGPDRLMADKEDRYPALGLKPAMWVDNFTEAEQIFRLLIDAIAPRRTSDG